MVLNLFVFLRKLALVTSLLLTCSQVFAENSPSSLLVIPKSTSLKLLKVESDHLEASFSERIWISGTFIARWSGVPQDINDENYAYLEYAIVPDRKSLTKLPYFKGYKPQALSLKSEDDALRKVVGEAKANQLLQHKINKIKVTGRFLLDSYVVGVECDSPWVSVNLVKYEVPRHLASPHEIPEGC